jgi:acetyl-CoA carboxylase carboxyl transferase subunit alpha
MRANVLELDRPLAELEERIAEVKRRTAEEGVDRSAEIAALETTYKKLMKDIYSNLTPWEKTLLARHPKRPYTLDYVASMTEDFLEMHGDRTFGDDAAIIAGMARLGRRWVMVIGHQKGRDIHQRNARNFGSARPEGYRKALRLMRLAEKCRRPIICIVDTPAADCSVGAEERGISEAIAHTMRDMFTLTVPVVVALTGEGGSGGAIGIGVGDRVLMLEHAIYSVIPPEGCAAILWRDAARGPDAAKALRLTAHDALHFGIVDEILAEPLGGAHRDPPGAAATLRAALERNLDELEALTPDQRLNQRYLRFRRLGDFAEMAA